MACARLMRIDFTTSPRAPLPQSIVVNVLCIFFICTRFQMRCWCSIVLVGTVGRPGVVTNVSVACVRFRPWGGRCMCFSGVHHLLIWDFDAVVVFVRIGRGFSYSQVSLEGVLPFTWWNSFLHDFLEATFRCLQTNIGNFSQLRKNFS